MNHNFGAMNGTAIGLIMQEMVRRAILIIRQGRFNFKVELKSPGMHYPESIKTDIDDLVQDMYIELIQSCFPLFGVIAEESNLNIPYFGNDADKWYFTVDPLDGTAAFARRQSDGISTMLALVKQNTQKETEVVAAYVGDVISQEIYGFHPGSAQAYRISGTGVTEFLEISPDLNLKDQEILLRDDPFELPSHVQRLFVGQGLFRRFSMSNGSIGTFMAKLWKNEVGGIFLPKTYELPWDNCPIYGISQKMGFKFYSYLENELKSVEPYIQLHEDNRELDFLIVHASREEELIEWFKPV